MKKIILITGLLITFAAAAGAIRFYTDLKRITTIQNDRAETLADGRLAAEKKNHTALRTSRCNHYHRKNYE